MVKPPLPGNEAQRLEALRRYDILDTPPEAAFERLTNLVARLFNVPIVTITLIDKERQWFKSCYGLEDSETGRDISFCAYAILSDQVMIVPNAQKDPRFADNPLVIGPPHLAFYAGAPLQTSDGFHLGTLCLIDTTPRELDQTQQANLTDLAALVMDEFELRQSNVENTHLHQKVQQELIERKEAEKALHQQRAFLRQVIDLNPNFIYARDRLGRFTLVNRTGANFYGITVEELLGKTDADFLNNSVEAAAILQEDLAIMDSLQEFGPQLRPINFKDEIRWLQVIKRPLLDENGQANQVLGIATDISALKRAEETMRESEQRYRSVVDNIKEVIFQTDTSGLWLFLNPAWTEISGFSIPESLGKDSLDYLHPDDRPQVLELRQALLAGDLEYCRYEARYLTKKGDFRWLEVYARSTLAADETIVGMGGTLNDVTDRKRAEQALLANETLFRTLTTHAPVGIFQANPQGECTFVNKRWSEICGLSSLEAMGTGWIEALHPDDLAWVVAEWQAAAASGREFSREFRYQTSTGKVTWVSGSALTLRNQAHEIEGYIGTITDITEQKQIELLERDRNQVLEMISQDRPLKQVLVALIHLVEGQYPELAGSILLLKDGRIYHGAAPNLPENFTRLIDGLAFGDILEAEKIAVIQEKPLIIANIAAKLKQNIFDKLALNYELQAYWLAPIFSSDGALLGIFIGYYRRPNRPTAPELQLVNTATRLAAIAVEHHQLNDQLAYQAQHDALTGLPNRLLFRERLQQAIVQARHNDQLVALLYVDLDRFKVINDTLGHAAGDRLLFQVTQRLQECLLATDTLARMGGDEFTIVLGGLGDPHSAARVAQRILEVCQEPFQIIGHELFITTSIGISFYPSDGDNTEELLRKADQALYLSKEKGKNTYQIYAVAVDDAMLELLTLERQLRGALSHNELQLYYQPQLEVGTGRLVGSEALLRWNHPELGLVSPTNFIPIAEESGLIIPIGLWTLQEACRQGQIWQRAGYPPLRIALNISALQFTQSDFVESVAEALAASHLQPDWLQLELTETILMHNTDEAVAKLARLKSLGVAIAIDDFGTGYSSMTYLQQLPVDTLKIAHSFVREIGVNLKNTPNDMAIVTAVTNLAHTLGMQVVAEGVETQQQLEFLRRIGCDEMQGYLFSQPVPAVEFEILLRSIKGQEVFSD